MRTLFLPLTGLLLSGSLLASAAQADEPRYNQISLQTQVEQAVNHDTMQVTFYAEAQDRDPAKLAAMRAIKSALDPRGIMNPGKIIPPADPFKAWGLSGEALGRFTGSGQ